MKLEANGYAFGECPVEVVDWLDHHRSSEKGWYDQEAMRRNGRTDCALRTVGFLIDETDSQVTLSPEQRGDKDQTEPLFERTMTILKATIVSRTRLSDTS